MIKLYLGQNDDLQLYHDGSNSFIKDTGTGVLVVNTNQLHVNNAANNENMLKATEDGAVELYHDNVKRFETDNAGVRVVAPEGARAELRILGDEGDDNNDYFKLSGGDGTLKIQDASNGSGWEDNIVINAAGSVELYHDNAKKAETVSGGFTVTGTCTATAFAGDGSAWTGIAGIPTGVIVLWSGAANAIPSGYVLCDGNNSTPDLRDRFLVGAGNSYSVGDTGGSNTATDTVNISASFSGQTSNDTGPVNNSSNKSLYSAGSTTRRHTHAFSGTASGSDTVSIDTRSPYYALCYIMKT